MEYRGHVYVQEITACDVGLSEFDSEQKTCWACPWSCTGNSPVGTSAYREFHFVQETWWERNHHERPEASKTFRPKCRGACAFACADNS